MTQQQATQFEKALAKAFAEDLHIVGHGTIKATGQQFIAVTSSDGQGVYTVTIAGHDLHCNCPAGTNGHYCKHRALARQSIEEKAAQAAMAPPVLRKRCEFGRSCNERATEIVEIAGGMDRHCCAWHAPRLREIYTWADAVKAADPDRVNPVLKDNSRRFLRV